MSMHLRITIELVDVPLSKTEEEGTPLFWVNNRLVYPDGSDVSPRGMRPVGTAQELIPAPSSRMRSEFTFKEYVYSSNAVLDFHDLKSMLQAMSKLTGYSG